MRSPESAYIRLVLGVAAAACLLIIAFNYLADPYGSYQVGLLGGSRTKPAVYNRVKLAKAYDIRRIAPEAIVLGTSRSHIGLRMSHPGWAVPVGRRYNAAFDGATTKEMYAYLRHAEAVHPLKQVVLGLDTWHLTNAPAFTRADFDADRLFVPQRPLHNLLVHADDVALLLSLDTTTASLNELHRSTHRPQWLAPDGQRLGDVFFRQIEPTFASSPAQYFRDVDRQEVGFMLEPPAAAATSERIVRPSARAERLTSLDYVARIIAFCREHDIDLRIFITPAHADQLELVDAMGHWGELERGKRALVELVAADKARHPAARAFPVFDFATYSSVTTEPVPPASSTAEMAYYWDSSHFKQQVGDWVLDRLFGTKVGAEPVPADFGIALTAANIDEVLSSIRAQQAAFHVQQPRERDYIESLIHRVRDKRAQAAHGSTAS